jgi:hypothetical protein
VIDLLLYLGIDPLVLLHGPLLLLALCVLV